MRRFHRALLALPLCALALDADAGLLDRTEEGVYLSAVSDIRPSAVGTMGRYDGAIGVVTLDNTKFRLIPNASYAAVGFDGRTYGSDLSRAIADALSTSRTFRGVLRIDPSALASRTLADVGASHGVSLFLGGTIEAASVDLIPLKMTRITVPSPMVSLTVRWWLKTPDGATVWEGQSTAESAGTSIETYKEYKNSEQKQRIEEMNEGLAPGESINSDELLYSDLYLTMLERAFGMLLDDALPKFAAAFESLKAAERLLPATSDPTDAGAAKIEVLREYGSVYVRLRGRKWEGEQGMFRVSQGDSKIANDTMLYQVICDGEVLDEGVVSATRTDKRGSLNAETFYTFEFAYDLEVPLGTRSLIILVDRPDLSVLDAATVSRLRASTGGSRQSSSGGAGVRTRYLGKISTAAEGSGVFYRDVEIRPEHPMYLSVYRNLLFYRKGTYSSGLLSSAFERLVMGSGKAYTGRWECSYRDHDPFDALGSVDWNDPRISPLLSDDNGDRKKACKAIAAEKYLAAAPALVETLSLDADDDVREEALKALIALDAPNAVYFMVRTFVWDAEEDNRERVYEYFVDNKRVEAVPYLEEYYFGGLGFVDATSRKAFKNSIRKLLEELTGKEYPAQWKWYD